uniref:Uncharacterized protein n=1 Tax=Anguilla anguilla TaxID=7936 RepID=A0A0E9WPA3_ANGAN
MDDANYRMLMGHWNSMSIHAGHSHTTELIRRASIFHTI